MKNILKIKQGIKNPKQSFTLPPKLNITGVYVDVYNFNRIKVLTSNAENNAGNFTLDFGLDNQKKGNYTGEIFFLSGQDKIAKKEFKIMIE